MDSQYKLVKTNSQNSIQKKCREQDKIEPQQFYDHLALKNNNRKLSELYEIRCFQNWVKAAIISDRAKIYKQRLETKSKWLNVCDIGCGKGGDLSKWEYAQTGILVGMDISAESLKVALERYQKSRRIKKIKLIQCSGSVDHEQFIQHIDQEIHFDFINMQFMANLMFSSEEEVDKSFTNIISKLVLNGEVILTITDSKRIISILQKKKTTQYYSIDCEDNEIELNQNKWGQKYLFYLQDSVGMKENDQITYVPEYLVPISLLEKKCQQHNLEIIINENFKKFYKHYRQKYEMLLHRMIPNYNSKWQLSQNKEDIIKLYRVVVLKAKSGQNPNDIARFPQLIQKDEEFIINQVNL